jgi:hypothetical protein
MIVVNEQQYEINDKVYMNKQLYKIVHIYDDGSLKLKSIKGKTNEIIFRVPVDFVTRE